MALSNLEKAFGCGPGSFARLARLTALAESGGGALFCCSQLPRAPTRPNYAVLLFGGIVGVAGTIQLRLIRHNTAAHLD